ncbi:aldose 1-epimerase family protein [Blastococcus sp. TF02A-26]|uniref:aldose 1-epimerase family protein n=1 Tax=Blastococcus sp. TF02A-26 TaxID=2250577 RepID=UPI000DE93CD7|nr:aldose 1-epimerase family protein [Blastococcus sp. TF02A-26]RBY83298.1 aldose epimerase [Blastococcus sp. TF02A-26]
MPVRPTGEQFVLTSGPAEVTVVEVGAGLRSYRHAGRELLDGYAETEIPRYSRGEVLAPWPNRIADGRWSWDGVEHQLALTEPDRATAIHGLVNHVPWTVLDRGPDRLELGYLLHPQPGYPFALRLRIAYELTGEGLRITPTATNEGDVPLPYGEGHHPYLAAGADLHVDDCTLVSPAATRLTTDERLIPTGREPVAGTPADLRRGRRLGDLRLDDCFTDLERGADGRAVVRLTRPDGTGAGVWMDGTYGYLQLFTGDTIPGDGRRRGVAVEPMTCPPNAFVTGEAVLRLAPGESVSGSWGLFPIG